MAQSKIDKHGLGEMALELSRDGHTTQAIAELLTEELHKRSHEDSVNQSTVARYLKVVRAEEQKAVEAAMDVAEERIKQHIKDGVGTDLEVVEEIQKFFKSIADNDLRDLDGKKHNVELKMRMDAAKEVVEVIKAKLGLPGLYGKGGDNGTGTGSGQPPVSPGSNVRSILDRVRKSTAS